MEEHFNENYIESHQYPKTSFKGKITDFDQTTLSDQPQTVELTGELSMHGVTKTITVPATITQKISASLWRLPFRSKHQTLALKSRAW